jgi:hypothetical protein
LPVLGQGDCVGIADRTGDEVLRLGHTRYNAPLRLATIPLQAP